MSGDSVRQRARDVVIPPIIERLRLFAQNRPQRLDFELIELMRDAENAITTAETMAAAWRKRAEEAESESALARSVEGREYPKPEAGPFWHELSALLAKHKAAYLYEPLVNAISIHFFGGSAALPGSLPSPAPPSALMEWIAETLESFESWKCEQTEVAINDLADHLDQMESLYVQAGGKLK